MNSKLPFAIEHRVGELRRQIAGMLRKYPMPEEDRRDLEQEVLLQTYSRVCDAAQPSAIPGEARVDSALIATIVKRRWVDSIRRAQDPARSALTNQFDRPEDDSSAGLADTATESVHARAPEDPAQAFLRKERTAYLQCRLTLAEQALLSRVADGWTDSEIAPKLGIPVEKAKSRIQDLKKKCRRILAEFDSVRA